MTNGDKSIENEYQTIYQARQRNRRNDKEKAFRYHGEKARERERRSKRVAKEGSDRPWPGSQYLAALNR